MKRRVKYYEHGEKVTDSGFLFWPKKGKRGDETTERWLEEASWEETVSAGRGGVDFIDAVWTDEEGDTKYTNFSPGSCLGSILTGAIVVACVIGMIMWFAVYVLGI